MPLGKIPHFAVKWGEKKPPRYILHGELTDFPDYFINPAFLFL